VIITSKLVFEESLLARSDLPSRVRAVLPNAVSQALLSTDMRERHGACVLKGARVLGSGFNSMRPLGYIRASRNRQFCNERAHAETSAMHRVCRDSLRGSTIIVIRLARDSSIVGSRPCDTCMRVMVRKGIKRCYYSVDSVTFGLIKFPWR